jgi:fucose 4-O-acetylase-like acetyltransferase
MDTISAARSRNQAIDVARGIAAILAVLGHTLAFSKQAGFLESVTHLSSPLFFFLSGIFLSIEVPWLSWFAIKMDALLKPYVVVLLLLGAYFYCAGNSSISQYLAGMVYAKGSTIALLPLWFLPHLFLSLNCAALLLRVGRCLQSDRLFGMVSAVMLLAIAPYAINIFKLSEGLPLSADLLPVSMALIFLGYIFADAARNFSVKPWVFCLSAVVYLGIVFYGDAKIDMNKRVYGDPLFTPIMIVAAIYLLLGISSCLVQWHCLAGRMLAWMGVNSLSILLFHFLWLRWLFGMLHHWVPDHVAVCVVPVFIACLLLCALTITIVRQQHWLSLLLMPALKNGKIA